MAQPETPEPNRKPANAPGWLNRMLQRFSQRAQGDVIATQIGENARNVVVGKNVIQIGTLQIPFYLAVLIAVGVIIIGVSTAVIAFSSSGLAGLLASPSRLTGQFNIAVADFGESNAQGHIQATDNGRLLSQWVYDALKNAYATNPDLAQLTTVEIRHASPGLFGRTVTLGVVAGDTPQAREIEAAKLSDKIGADMVIYGNINQAAPSGLALEFYIAPQLQPETSALIGRYRLGGLIPVPLPFKANDPLGKLAVSEDLTTRTTALFYLAAGLTFDLLGRPAQALTIFRQAENQLTGWKATDGKEILYFFIGREALFLAQDKDKQTAALQEAEKAATQALAIKPDYVRAQIVLGGVYYRRAQQLPPADRLMEPSALTIALTNYEQAVALAEQSEDPFMQSVAHLALALALRTKGQTYYLRGDAANANAAFDQATATIEQTLQPLAAAQQYRLLAQAHLALGEAYFQQADVDRQQGKLAAQKQHFTQASTAFANCIAQGPKAPLDQILHEDIIAKRCQPQQANVEKALQQVAGG